MLNLKKTAIAVLALGSSAVFAGTMGPVCTPGSVTVPCESTAWDFGIQALYLEHNNNDYIGVGFHDEHRSAVQDEESWHHRGHNNNWNWGFRLEGSYHFSTGNDINVNWYHFDNGRNRGNRDDRDEHRDLVAVQADDVVFTDDQVRPRWDAVNLEFGQRINFGERTMTRLHAGLQYANLERRQDFILPTREKSNGVGPRVGAETSYGFGNGFGIYGNAAAGLLVGKSNFRAEVDGVDIHVGSRNAVIPELEGELGVNYRYSMGSGDLNLKAGYYVVNYFNGTQTAPLATTDFALSGIIFGGTWVGNIA